MATALKPNYKISREVLPGGILSALQHIFAQGISGCGLVGGTALSGFYAGHRRSDDIDIFVESAQAFKQTILAVKSLTGVGAVLSERAHSGQYYKALCNFKKHDFTIDVVLDSNLFTQGTFFSCNKIMVASLPTLFMMKAATIVSRCGEKDLYDLMWLFKHLESMTVEHIFREGLRVDAGLNGESLLFSLASTKLSQSACGFSVSQGVSAGEVFKQISVFKKKLIPGIHSYLDGNANSELKKLVDIIKSFGA